MPDILEYYDGLASDARQALFDTKALDYCGRHDVTIRVGNEEAERRAYAYATVTAKRDGKEDDLPELRKAIAAELGEAADESCPGCDKFMSDD